MQVDPEEFRRRFEDLSDAALLEIDWDELVEVAQDLYRAELERRGLLEETEAAEPEPEAVDGKPAEGKPDDPRDELVLAAECGSSQELAFARSLLKSADIPTYGQTDFSGVLAATEADTKLYVPASYLEQAQELLSTPLTDEELAEQAEAAGEELEAEEAPAQEHEEQGREEEGGLN
jgi:hypothetical protein